MAIRSSRFAIHDPGWRGEVEGEGGSGSGAPQWARAPERTQTRFEAPNAFPPHRRRAILDVCTEKDDGTKTIAGCASALDA